MAKLLDVSTMVGRWGDEAQYAVVASEERVDEVVLNLFGHQGGGQGHFGHFGHFDLEVGLHDAVFLEEVALPFGFHRFFERSHVLSGEGEHSFGFAGNGVPHVAALPFGQSRLEVGNGVGHHASEVLVGVGASLVDLQTGVSAAQTVERDAHRLVVGIGSYGLEFEFGGEVDATGRSDHEFAVGFVVEVEENVAFEEAVFHVFHAVHGGFLVGGHEGSRGPWQRVSSSKMAMMVAMAMPSSAPRVVLRARTQSPSIHVSMGSVSKLWGESGVFCGTMSM